MRSRALLGSRVGRNADIVWGFARTQVQQHLAYPGDFWLAPLARMGVAFALIGFWNAVYAAGAAPGGLTKPMMLTWAAAAVVLNRLVSVDIAGAMEERIRRGDIVFEVLRPTDFQLQALGAWLGHTAYAALIDTLPISLVVWGIARVDAAPSLGTFGLALASLALAMLTAFFLQFTVILVGFWTIRVRTWTWLLNSVFALAAGAFVPLWLLPDGLRAGLQYLPFATLFHAPLSIFVGRAAGSEALHLILAQLAWLPPLWALSRWMMGQARRRVLIQGG